MLTNNLRLRIRKIKIIWDVLELWSGTGRFSLTALNANLRVGCPIDCRYGWDMNNPHHRAMISEMIHYFQVKVTLSAPDCRVWSRSSNTSDPEVLRKERIKQMDNLEWLTQECEKADNNLRGYIVENPWSSDMWSKSPLNRIVSRPGRSKRKSSQCVFGACHPETGEACRKDTGWLSNLKLRKLLRVCDNRHTHTLSFKDETLKQVCLLQLLQVLILRLFARP